MQELPSFLLLREANRSGLESAHVHAQGQSTFSRVRAVRKAPQAWKPLRMRVRKVKLRSSIDRVDERDKHTDRVGREGSQVRFRIFEFESVHLQVDEHEFR